LISPLLLRDNNAIVYNTGVFVSLLQFFEFIFWNSRFLNMFPKVLLIPFGLSPKAVDVLINVDRLSVERIAVNLSETEMQGIILANKLDCEDLHCKNIYPFSNVQ
jgi:hypothetical protein